MTMNELIAEAKENGIDFDEDILCINIDEMGEDCSNATFDFSNNQLIVANENFKTFINFKKNPALEELKKIFDENGIDLDAYGFNGWCSELIAEQEYDNIEDAIKFAKANKLLEEELGAAEHKYSIISYKGEEETYFVDATDTSYIEDVDYFYDEDEYKVVKKNIA